MYIFIDESGHPKNIVQGPYVLTACIIPTDVEVNYVENLVLDVKRRFNMPIDLELKAKDIIEGHGAWRKIKLNVRQKFLECLIDELSNYATKYRIPRFIVVVIRREWGTKPNPDEVLRKGYEVLLERVLLCANKLHSQGYRFRYIHCIIDSSGVAQDVKVRATIEKVIEESRYLKTMNIPFKNYICVTFRDSKREVCIQLSDIVAYLARLYIFDIGEKNGFNIEKLWSKIWNNLLDKGKGGIVEGYGFKEIKVK